MADSIIKWMAKEPKFGDSSNEKNIDNATPEKIRTLKEESLFSPKNSKSIEEKKEERDKILKQENNESQDFNNTELIIDKDEHEEEKHDEIIELVDGTEYKETWVENIENSKYSSLITRLFETNKISNDTKNILLSEDLDNIDINKVEWISDKNERKNINEAFDKIKNKTKNLEVFQKEVKTLKNKQYLNSFDLEIKDWKYDSEVLNMVWWNYIEFPSSENKKEIEKDLSAAIVLTKSDIEKKYTNLSRGTETYKVAIDNIKSWDLAKQMSWINSLYVLAASKAWELSQKKIDKHISNKKDKLIKEFQELDKEFDELAKKETTNEVNKRKKEINERIIEIWDEANEVEAWDIFESDDKEKIQSNIESISENK